MKLNLLRRVAFAALVMGLAISLTACGQRMEPKAPAGKIIPSEQY